MVPLSLLLWCQATSRSSRWNLCLACCSPSLPSGPAKTPGILGKTANWTTCRVYDIYIYLNICLYKLELHPRRRIESFWCCLGGGRLKTNLYSSGSLMVLLSWSKWWCDITDVTLIRLSNHRPLFFPMGLLKGCDMLRGEKCWFWIFKVISPKIWHIHWKLKVGLGEIFFQNAPFSEDIC